MMIKTQKKGLVNFLAARNAVLSDEIIALQTREFFRERPINHHNNNRDDNSNGPSILHFVYINVILFFPH